MTTYIPAFLAAWAIGYVLGWQIRAIKNAIYAG